MNQNELIESIIKEVKRVLALRGIQVAPSPGTSSQPGSYQPAAPSLPQKEQPVECHDLTCRKVITQKDLEAFHGQSVTVAKKAVITPLAFDYARDRGITITRVDK